MGVSSAYKQKQTMARTADIITAFELEVNDMTEMSSTEELLILNRVYKTICLYPFEFLKTNVTGTILSDSTSYYITLPADFNYLSGNADFSESYQSNDYNLKPRVIFVGTNYVPYKLVNFSDRRQYRNTDGYCYLDLANSKIRFLTTPSALRYDFDYIKIPTTLTTSDAPVWANDALDKAIVYGMAQENEILQRSDKARSYKQDFEVKYSLAERDLKQYNARLISY